MEFFAQEFEGLFLIQPTVVADNRGSFSRIFCLEELKKVNFHGNFVQSNISYNRHKGTLRGLHFQKKPFGEVKLVRCVSGSIVDIVVDVRPESKTFLKNFQVPLSEQNNLALLIPAGCAHGFITLEDNSSVLYNHSTYYEPLAESGLRHDDPKLNLSLPFPLTTISERDLNHPLISENFKGYL